MTKSNNFVSESYIRAVMSQAEYDVIDGLFDKTTIVSAKMPNGFVIVASSSCVDPSNYDPEIGIKICKKEIENKLWELEGYALAERLYKGQ